MTQALLPIARRALTLLLLGLALLARPADAEIGTVNLPALNPVTVVRSLDNCPSDKLDFLKESLIGAILQADGWPLKFSLISRQALRSEKAPSADVVFADPSTAAGLYRYAGYMPLLALVPSQAAGAGEAAAAALYVPTGASEKTFHALSGAKILINNADEMNLRTFFAADLSRQGLDSDTILRHASSMRESIEETASRMLRGEAQAVLLPACEALKLPAHIRQRIRIVEPRPYDALRCPHSTTPSPGWMILVSTRATKEHAAWLKVHFLASNQPEGAYRWMPAPPLNQLIALMTAGKDRTFASFRQFSWRDIVQENTGVFLTVFFVLLGLLGWSIVSTLKLARNASALLRTQERLGNLERVSIVGQMSSMVAHELRQPIFAIRNYAGSLRRRRDRGALSADDFNWAIRRIVEESERANAIVEHVRNYAKGGSEQHRQRGDLSQAVEQSYNEQRSKLRFAGRFSAEIAKSIEAEFDSLEVGLIMRTLMKNAVEASEGNPEDMICVRLCEEAAAGLSPAAAMPCDPQILLEVRDTSKVMTPEALARLGTPVHSQKTEGLGLGLSIICRIIERWGGTIRFAANRPKGLIVRIYLPKEVLHVDRNIAS